MTPHTILKDPDFRRLKHRLIETTGLAYYADKDSDLAFRILRRLEATRVRTCASYMAILDGGTQGRQELDILIGELTIGETYFFRQSEHFRALRETVLPDVLRRNAQNRRVRIWSAGCATGAEPYSIALLLETGLGREISGWDISILGTDINRKFLARAKEGRFDDWAFRECPPEVRARCFHREGKEWVLRPEYRTWTTFLYHNLASDPAPSLVHGIGTFDLILCRNVMIYFSAEVVRATVERLYNCLVEEGWLLVGHAEPNQQLFRQFRSVWEAGCTLYQKNGMHNPEPQAPAPEPPAWTPPRLPEMRQPPGVEHAAPPERAATVREIHSLADSGRLDEALARCRMLLENHGLAARDHFVYSLVLRQTGAHEEAERALRRALYLDRGFALAHFHLGLVLQHKGQAEQARKSFLNALRLLEARADEHPLDEGDGMTAGELKELVRIQLEVLP